MFLEIKGYNNYIINEAGDVFNSKHNRPLKPFIDSSGYPVVELWENGIGKKFLLHRIVAETFIPNPENKPQVNHKDGNRRNPHKDNLEWCTNYENVQHSIKRNGKNLSKKTVMKLYRKQVWSSVEDFVIELMKF